MMRFCQLGIGYNRKIFLEDLNGELNPGELIALIGANGAGKSCLLKTLAGLNKILAGHIEVAGRQLSELNPIERAKTIAIVLTERNEPDYLRVDELLLMGRYPWQEHEINTEKLKEVAAILKIENLLKKEVSSLSDGQKQKVFLGRALMQDTQYLILDEPTSFLDMPTKAEFITTLKAVVTHSSKAILFSTHEWELVRTKADKIWLLDNEGRLHIKKPEEIETSGLFKMHLGF